jgi:DNA-binding response OmpR family regulator
MTEKGRILLLAGDEDIGRNVADRLTALGFEVVARDDAQEPQAISGILLGLDDSSQDGLATFRAVRDRHAHVPVIVMSDAAKIPLLRRALELGAQEYLVTPFDEELLRRKCLRVFGREPHGDVYAGQKKTD